MGPTPSTCESYFDRSPRFPPRAVARSTVHATSHATDKFALGVARGQFAQPQLSDQSKRATLAVQVPPLKYTLSAAHR